MTIRIELEREQAQQLLNVLATCPAPWIHTNPVIVQLSQQLQPAGQPMPMPLRPNGDERHEQAPGTR